MPRALEISLLRTFHAVARLGRFNTAAEYLGKSTSAVSVHVRRLEDIAGTRLLERDNQGIVLTPRGRQFAADSTALLAEHDRVLAALTVAPAVGRLRFGIPEEYASRFLNDLLPLFAMEHPGVELDIEAASSEVLTGLFDRRKLDAAVTVVTDRASPDRVLAEVRPVWVAERGLRAFSNAVLPVALHAQGCPYRELAVTALNDVGPAWRPVLSSGNSAAILTAVASGLATAVMDGKHLATTLVAVPDRFGLPALPPCWIVYRSHDRGNAERRLQAAAALFFRGTE